MPVKKPSVGDIVSVVFLDHAENSRDAIRFEVIGRVSSITRAAYMIRVWGYIDDIDRASDNNPSNEHWFAIVKSAIESIKVLK